MYSFNNIATSSDKFLFSKNSLSLSLSLESYLEESPNTVYLILDESQVIEDMEDKIAHILSSLLAKYKNKFNIIIVSKDFGFLEQEAYEYIKKQTVLTIKFTPQSKSRIKETIKDLTGKYNINLSKEEIDCLAVNSLGSPLIVKQTLLKMIEGLTLKEALKKKDIKINKEK